MLGKLIVNVILTGGVIDMKGLSVVSFVVGVVLMGGVFSEVWAKTCDTECKTDWKGDVSCETKCYEWE